MSEYCMVKMKSGKRKGRPCLEDAVYDNEGDVVGDRVFCRRHAPPPPPQTLDDMLDLLTIKVATVTQALAEVPDDVLRKALTRTVVITGRAPGECLVGLHTALAELQERLDMKPDGKQHVDNLAAHPDLLALSTARVQS